MPEAPQPQATGLIVEPLAPHHDRAAFSCGVPELDTYVKQFAAQHDRRDVARPFVVVPSAGSASVMAYCTLSNYAIICQALPPALAKGLPTRISLPGTLIGRLAVARQYQGQGLGKRLLLYALREALRAARTSASLGVVVDAMTDELVPFYTGLGFVELLDKPRHLLIPMTRIRAMFPQDAAGLPDVEAIIREAATAAAILDELSKVESLDAAPALVAELQRRMDAILGRGAE